MKSILTFTLAILLFSCENNSTETIAEVKNSEPVFKIEPPIPGAEPEGEIFAIDNSKDTILITDHGSFVSVPANCFCDEKGNAVEKNIEVVFKEYSNTADILLSGIPMQFIENGDTQIFQSAGMCDIEAFSGENKLVLKDSNSISIGLRNQAQESDYNLYYFDTLQGEWIEQKKNIPLIMPDALPVKPVNLQTADTNRIIAISIENYTQRPLHKMWHRSRFYMLSGQRLRHANDSVWWYDVSVNETKNEDVFELRFQGMKGEKQYRERVLVQPMIDSSNFEEGMSLFRNNMISYAKELLAIQEKIDRDEEEGGQREATRQKGEEVMRVFGINQMGTYNCDRFYNRPDLIENKKIQFCSDGVERIFAFAYLLSPADNLVTSYVPYSLGYYSLALHLDDQYFVGIGDGKLYGTSLSPENVPFEVGKLEVQELTSAELETIVQR